MEYLTLQDIPHRRFYNPRRMVSPEETRASERALPGMAAVREFEHDPLCPPTLVPAPSDSSLLPTLDSTPQPAPPSHPFLHKMDDILLLDPALSAAPFNMADEQRAAQTLTDLPVLGKRKELPSDSDLQNHHIRHSPPLQPGEQRGLGQSGKLPSFKQVCPAAHCGSNWHWHWR